MEISKKKETYYILCIDDDVAFLNSLSMLLPQKLTERCPEYSIRFEFFSVVDDLFDLIGNLTDEGEKIAVVISDQKMPDSTGIEIFEKIRVKLPDTMCILLTGFGGIDSARYAINHHLLDQYISKPIDDYDNFISILRHLLTRYHLLIVKHRQEEEIKKHLISLSAANHKIENLLKAAEEMAFFSKNMKMLDLDEVLNLVMKKIPELFSCNCVSVFLFKEDEINKLCLVRTNYIKNAVEIIIDEKDLYPVKDLSKDFTGKIVDERVYDGILQTPLQKALSENAVVIIHDVRESNLRFLGKEELGLSCIIIPFIVRQEQKQKQDHGSEVRIGGILSISGFSISKDEDEFWRYKACLIRDIIGANISNAQIFARTQKLAVTDSLTGLYNTIMLNNLLENEIERARRISGEFSVVVCDVDDFQRFNEKHGHLTGDMILRRLANLLDRIKRGSDFLFRYGGEEFAYILPETNVQQALVVIDRIRKEIEGMRFSENDGDLLTLSFGIVQYVNSPSPVTAKDLLAKADKAMSLAKEKGKNRVEVI